MTTSADMRFQGEASRLEPNATFQDTRDNLRDPAARERGECFVNARITIGTMGWSKAAVDGVCPEIRWNDDVDFECDVDSQMIFRM